MKKYVDDSDDDGQAEFYFKLNAQMKESSDKARELRAREDAKPINRIKYGLGLLVAIAGTCLWLLVGLFS
jgi:hypothetical protein